MRHKEWFNRVDDTGIATGAIECEERLESVSKNTIGAGEAKLTDAGSYHSNG